MNEKLKGDNSRASHPSLRRRMTLFGVVAIAAATMALAHVAHVMTLIICAGNTLVDALALVTASHLDRRFLVVGAQLPAPTVNVTAAIWRGASSLGGEVPDTVSSFDPNAFTPEHADAAIRAGVASVLNDFTGIVISLD